MKGHLLVLCADEVVDDVGSRGRAARVAEPFLADEAFDDAGGVVDATVAEREQRGRKGGESNKSARAFTS